MKEKETIYTKTKHSPEKFNLDIIYDARKLNYHLKITGKDNSDENLHQRILPLYHELTPFINMLLYQSNSDRQLKQSNKNLEREQLYLSQEVKDLKTENKELKRQLEELLKDDKSEEYGYVEGWDEF